MGPGIAHASPQYAMVIDASHQHRKPCGAAHIMIRAIDRINKPGGPFRQRGIFKLFANDVMRRKMGANPMSPQPFHPLVHIRDPVHRVPFACGHRLVLGH